MYGNPAKNFLFCSNVNTGFAEEGEIVRPKIHSFDVEEDEEDIEEEEEEEEDIEEEDDEEEDIEEEEEEDEDLEAEEVLLLHCCSAVSDR